MWRAAFAVSLACCSGAGCAGEVRTVKLRFVEEDGRPSGFGCLDDADRRLVDRAMTGSRPARWRFNLVVDFIDVGGLPECSLAGIDAQCASGGCELIEAARGCYPVEFAERVRPNLLDALHGLSGDTVTRKAPDGDLVIRAVGTVEPCESVLAQSDPSFATSDLIGCAHTCPRTFPGVEGELRLQLSTEDRMCMADVATCAGL